jgi:hypothetical protein
MSIENLHPREQEPTEYTEAKAYLRGLFGEKDEKKVEQLFVEVRFFASHLHMDADSLVERLRSGFQIQNPDEFVRVLFLDLKEFIDEKKNHPEVFEKIRHEYRLQRGENIKLSDLMYYEFDFQDGVATVHVGEKGSMGLGEVLKSFREGMKELVRRVREDERIKEIQATSWIVATNPGLLEKIGFTVHGLISEKMRKEDFTDETRPVAWASITREKLLEKYPA